MDRKDCVWKSSELAENYLANVRGGIPVGAEQIRVMMRVIRSSCPRVQSFIDVGCGDELAVFGGRKPD